MTEKFDFDQCLEKILCQCSNLLELPQNSSFEIKTVVFADLVDSTSAKDEYGHSRGMKRCRMHNNIATKTFNIFNGKIVKYIGDAVLACFSSNLEAIVASVMFRSVLESLKQEGEEFRLPMETKITITTGSLEEFQDNSGFDIGGQVVDTAARLQEVASPGQILAEAGVVKSNRLLIQKDFPFIKISENSNADELQLKGIKEPIKIVEITTNGKTFGPPPSERGQYLYKVTRNVIESKSRIWLSIRSMKSRQNRRDIANLQDQLAIAQKFKNIDVRILYNEWGPEILKTSAELEKLNLKVRFFPTNTDSSINIIDRKIILHHSRKNNHLIKNEKFWEIQSVHINTVMAEDFLDRWKKAISPRLQLAEHLTLMNDGSRNSSDRTQYLDYISGSLGIDSSLFIDNSLILFGLISNIQNIFIIGKPGSGKSSIRTLLAEFLEEQMGAKVAQFDDYSILHKHFQDDYNCLRFISQGSKGFMVRDQEVLNEVLRGISEELQIPERYVTKVIEFARADYKSAFNAFSPRILKKSVAIIVQCPEDQMYQRLENRIYQGGPYVSREVIERFYSSENACQVCEELRIPFQVVNNFQPMNQLKNLIKQIGDWLKIQANRHIAQEEQIQIIG